MVKNENWLLEFRFEPTYHSNTPEPVDDNFEHGLA
jgi:hypothetical protein